MTIIVQLSAVGINITLFDIYSNIDYDNPIVTGISKMQLLAGYSLLNVPDNATTIRLSSTGNCSTYTDIAIGGLITTTTTSTTAIPTTTTTSTTLNCSFIVNAQEITTTSTTSTTTTAPPTLRAVVDVSSSPQCDGSVLVTVRPGVNAYVNITSSFAPGGGAVYLAALPVEAGVTNIYSNLSDDVVNAGITKKYRFGISAYRYTSGIGNIYTSNIYIAVRDAVDDSLLADYVFYRTHIDQQC